MRSSAERDASAQVSEVFAKEEAIKECAHVHSILLHCFKTCTAFNPFCCSEENKAFWECYKSKRGMGDKTYVGHYMEKVLGNPRAEARKALERERAREERKGDT